MYFRNFMERINIASISKFILTGEEYFTEQDGSYWERHRTLEKEFHKGLRLFRERVIEHDWSLYEDENQKTIASEKMWNEIVEASGELEDLYFEAGLRAGYQLMHDFSDSSSLIFTTKGECKDMIRKIDDLGRIVLPKELRSALDWKERDALKITQSGPAQVILEKANDTCFICGAADNLVTVDDSHICASCCDKVKTAKEGQQQDAE